MEDVLGILPSLPPPDDDDRRIFGYTDEEAVKKFKLSLAGKKQLITDKTRARHILYSAAPSAKLLTYVLRLLPRHPEHIDAFVCYLSHYTRSNRIIKACHKTLRLTPYEYVQGELWHVLARLMSRDHMQGLISWAVEIAKSNKNGFAVKWGACHFLCVAEQSGLGDYGKFVKYQSCALLQSLLVPILPDKRFAKGDVVDTMLRRTAFEPGILLAAQLSLRKLTHRDFGLKSKDLPSQVRNVFKAIGVIRGGTGTVDPMGELLTRRYRIERWTRWKALFGQEYGHGMQLLSQAEPIFNSGRSQWLSYQSSFNNALFLAMQVHLTEKKMPGAVGTKGRDGKLVSFGTLIDSNQPFAKAHPMIADVFREVNSRRNTIPGSHPYETKGGARTRHLKKSEQEKLVKKLSIAYSEIINLFSSLIE
jgi:hypothetical protein